MKSLYQISNDLQQLYVDLSSSVNEDGEITDEEIVERIGDLSDQFTEKATSVGIVIRMMETDCDLIDSEIRRLKEMKEREERNRDRLLDYLSNAMNQFGIEKIETPKAIIKFQNSSRTICENVDELPSEYVREKVERKPDLVAIKQAIESGIPVNGCYIYQVRKLKVK